MKKSNLLITGILFISYHFILPLIVVMLAFKGLNIGEDKIIAAITSGIDRWYEYLFLIIFIPFVIYTYVVIISAILEGLKSNEFSIKEELPGIFGVIGVIFIAYGLPFITFMYVCNSRNIDLTISGFLGFSVLILLISFFIRFFWDGFIEIAICFYVFILIHNGGQLAEATKENSVMNSEISTQNNISEKNWQDYQPESGVFSVKTPGKFDVTSENKSGIIDNKYITTDQNMRVIYGIDHIKMPEETFNSIEIESFVTAARKQLTFIPERDEIINDTWYVEGKLIASEEIIKKIKWANNGKIKMITKFLGNNIFSITITYDSSLSDEVFQPFIDSFKILK